MNRTARVLVLVLAMPMLVAAQAVVNGRWEGQTPNRQAIALDLDAKDGSLTGTMTVGEQKAAIENGKVAKNTFSFSVVMGGSTEGFTGELAGDEIKMWMDKRGPSAAIALKRVKPAQK